MGRCLNSEEWCELCEFKDKCEEYKKENTGD